MTKLPRVRESIPPAFLPVILAQPILGKWLNTSCATWPKLNTYNPDRFGGSASPAWPALAMQIRGSREARADGETALRACFEQVGGGPSTGDDQLLGAGGICQGGHPR